MHSRLLRELAVVVQHRVQGHVGVAHVVADHGRPLEQAGVVADAKSRDQLPVDLGGAPGHAAPLTRVGAVLGQVLGLHPRHSVEGPGPESVEVEVVVGAFALKAGRAPEVRIDGVLRQVVGVAREQLAQGRGQGQNRLAVDQPVAGEAPGGKGRGQGHQEDEEEARAWAQRNVTVSRTGRPLRSTSAESWLSPCSRG